MPFCRPVFWFAILVLVWIGTPSLCSAEVPFRLNHQGVVKVNGNPFSGTGEFRFALVDTDSGDELWTNDGSSTASLGFPNLGVSVAVVNGLYNVVLGDGSLPNMTPIPSSAFDDDQVVLRVWFSDGTNGIQRLLPDHPMTSTPYSFHSGLADRSLDGVPSGFSIISESPEAPPGFTDTGLRSKVGDTWRTRRALPTARYDLGVAAVDGKIYAIGGATALGGDDRISNLNERYDPATDTWETMAPMPTARTSLGVAALEGQIHAIGGYDGMNAVGAHEVYDPVDNSWTTRPPLPVPRQSFGIASAEGKIYAIGGTDGSGRSILNSEYDPVTNSWDSKTGLSPARNDFAAAVIRRRAISIGASKDASKGGIGVHDFVYTIGGSISAGNDDQEGFNDEYDPVGNDWEEQTNLPLSVDGHVAVTLENRIYAFGVNIQFSPTARLIPTPLAQVFNYPTKTWLPLSPMPTIRRNPAAAAAGGKVYVIGGRWSSDVLNTVEEYTPTRAMSVYEKE